MANDPAQNGETRPHWTEETERVYEGGSGPLTGLIGEDGFGDFWCPSWRRREWWDRRLNLRRPTHWLPYLHSRLTRKLAFLDD